MKTIAVTGGKGGTGKSTVATAIAYELSKKHKVLLADLDVDCPNDHLILNIKQKKIADVEKMIPIFDLSKCNKCGECAKACNSNAIVQVKDKFPLFFEEQCNGCNACFIACKKTGRDAISQGKKVIGKVMFGRNKGIDLISGFLNMGEPESAAVVEETKELALKKAKDYDYLIIDTAAGSHCPVISAVMDVDFAIAVTEPTPLGLHDTKIIIDLLKELKIKQGVVLNKTGLGNEQQARDLLEKTKTRILAEIPFKKSISKDYAEGKIMQSKEIKDLVKEIG